MPNRSRLPLVAVWMVLAFSTSREAIHAAEPAFVWWEGEDTEKTNFPERSWFGADTFPEKRHEVLSGGDWLSAYSPVRGTRTR